MKRTPTLLIVAFVAACSSPMRSGAPAGSVNITNMGGPDTTLLALRWYRASAEMPALYLQTYGAATTAVERMAPAERGAWGVIMDADETVLDNSMYQLMRGGAGYSADSWAAWARSRKAAALPGSIAFVTRVRALGGKVVIVTNREEAVCEDTRANLRSVGLDVDEVLCKATASSDKNPRFEAVQSGAAPSVLSPLHVIMWLGDNIQDFPKLSQAVRLGGVAGYSEFGRSFFVLPNPLYGSWDKNPWP